MIPMKTRSLRVSLVTFTACADSMHLTYFVNFYYIAECRHQKFGYKIIGDNIDKNVNPRFQTLANPTKSLHYFHAYAVKDRIDISELTDIPPSVPNQVDINTILPSVQSNANLKAVFEVLVSRWVYMHTRYMTFVYTYINWLLYHAWYLLKSVRSFI
jgi:L1 cell adhesion molecule like protein